jgi:plastocyanin
MAGQDAEEASMMRHSIGLVAGVVLALLVAACTASATPSASGSSTSSSAAAGYTPQNRKFEMVTIQELIGEFANIPELKDETENALKEGGPTMGHEVYAWDPDSLTVYQGDTVEIEIGNAQGEDHIFVLPDLGVSETIPGDSTKTVTFTASKVGIFQFVCGVPEHLPWMQGFLTVLPDSAAG